MPELEQLTGIKRATIYKRIVLERFPRQVKADDGIARWLESEVAAWLANPR